MTTYLSGGWFGSGVKSGLRTEVLDGAIDTAGLLHRAGIDPAHISRLALRVRGLFRIGDAAPAIFSDDDRAAIVRRLEAFVGDSPELTSFVADCVEHISALKDLTAFYLHLIHITRMMQLLTLAQRGPDLMMTPSPCAMPATPSTSPAKTATVRKRKSSAKKINPTNKRTSPTKRRR